MAKKKNAAAVSLGKKGGRARTKSNDCGRVQGTGT
jgi:hypothetical protein